MPSNKCPFQTVLRYFKINFRVVFHTAVERVIKLLNLRNDQTIKQNPHTPLHPPKATVSTVNDNWQLYSYQKKELQFLKHIIGQSV